MPEPAGASAPPEVTGESVINNITPQVWKMGKNKCAERLPEEECLMPISGDEL